MQLSRSLSTFTWRIGAAIAGLAGLAVLAPAAGAQPADASGRVAALRGALARGLVVPRDSVAVAIEPYHVTGFRLAATPAEEQQYLNEARQLAALIGPGAIVAASKDVLQCNRSDCAASTGRTVVVVDTPGTVLLPNGTYAVLLSVFGATPVKAERTVQRTSIGVVPSDGGYTAAPTSRIRSSIIPSRVPPRTILRNRLPSNARAATDLEQLAFEIVVARHVLAMDSVLRAIAGFAIDPRIYNLGWNSPAKRTIITSSEVPAAHADTNAAFVGGTMGLPTIVDDSRSCPVFRPSECRMGSHPGVVTFSRALVRGDEAQISLLRMTRSVAKPGAEPVFDLSGWRFTLTRTQGQWSITRAATMGTR
jgi:hypothetical protein